MKEKPLSPRKQLDGFISKYAPEVQRVARGALAILRARLPGSTELVYDKRGSLVVGFGPSERVTEAIFSIALYTRWVNLYFLQGGPSLPDPGKLLQGSGTRVRHIRLDDASVLERPAVKTLMAHALGRAVRPLDASGDGGTVIRHTAGMKPRSRRAPRR
ncbi:hypothetical protein HY251_05365 [bacterium]|nr:hypothetical protein [bacterium]